jgi:hypothetical protein
VQTFEVIQPVFQAALCFLKQNAGPPQVLLGPPGGDAA